MAYKITVSKDGMVFAETEPVPAEELPGLLKIMEKPSMFGAQGFRVSIERV